MHACLICQCNSFVAYDFNAAVGYDKYPHGYYGGYWRGRDGFMGQAESLGSEQVFNIGLTLFETRPDRFAHQLCLS